MAYDEGLADRIRAILKRRRGITEKRMFGGIAFFLRGNMLCGVAARDLVVRVGPEAYESALAKPHARPMDLTGRPLAGMVFVTPEGVKRAAHLQVWLDRSIQFARKLPAKK